MKVSKISPAAPPLSPTNDNTPGYIQAVLVLVYDSHEEQREAFAASMDALKNMAERIYNETPAVIGIVIWLQERNIALVYNKTKT